MTHSMPDLTQLPVAALLLAKLTVLLAVAWLLHGLLSGRNPRRRVLLWRLALGGVLLLLAGEAVLPRLSVAVPASWMARDGGRGPRADTATAQPIEPFRPATDEGLALAPTGAVARAASGAGVGAAPLAAAPVRRTGLGGLVDSAGAAAFSAGRWLMQYPAGWLTQRPSRWLMALWLAGALALAVRLAASYRALRRLVRGARPAPQYAEDLLRQMAEQMGLNASQPGRSQSPNGGRLSGIAELHSAPGGVVPSATRRSQDAAGSGHPEVGAPSSTIVVRVADGIASPFVTGWLRPVIVLPAAMVEERHRALLPGIFAHELAHLAAGDLFWMLLGRWVGVALWFHPLAWGMRRAHDAACEEVCDGVAAQYAGGAPAYSQMLARAFLELAAETPHPIAASMIRPAEIVRRIRRLRAGLLAPRLSRLWVSLALATGLMTIGILAGLKLDESKPAPKQPPIETEEERQEYAQVRATKSLREAVEWRVAFWEKKIAVENDPDRKLQMAAHLGDFCAALDEATLARVIGEISEARRTSAAIPTKTWEDADSSLLNCLNLRARNAQSEEDLKRYRAEALTLARRIRDRKDYDKEYTDFGRTFCVELTDDKLWIVKRDEQGKFAGVTWQRDAASKANVSPQRNGMRGDDSAGQKAAVSKDRGAQSGSPGSVLSPPKSPAPSPAASIAAVASPTPVRIAASPTPAPTANIPARPTPAAVGDAIGTSGAPRQPGTPRKTPAHYEWPLDHPASILDGLTSHTEGQPTLFVGDPTLTAKEIVALTTDWTTTNSAAVSKRYLAFGTLYLAYTGAGEHEKARFIAQKYVEYLDQVLATAPADSQLATDAKRDILPALKWSGNETHAQELRDKWGYDEFENYLKYSPYSLSESYGAYTSYETQKARSLRLGDKAEEAIQCCERLAQDMESWETKHQILADLPEKSSDRNDRNDKANLRRFLPRAEFECEVELALAKTVLALPSGTPPEARERAVDELVQAKKVLDSLPEDTRFHLGTRAGYSVTIDGCLANLGVDTQTTATSGLQLRRVAAASQWYEAERLPWHGKTHPTSGKPGLSVLREVLLSDKDCTAFSIAPEGPSCRIVAQLSAAARERLAGTAAYKFQKQVAVVLNHEVLATVTIQDKAANGEVPLTGPLSAEEAQVLINALEARPAPAPSPAAEEPPGRTDPPATERPSVTSATLAGDVPADAGATVAPPSLPADYLADLVSSLRANFSVPVHSQGVCVVDFKIARDGTLSEIRIHTSSGKPSLDELALGAVRKTGRVRSFAEYSQAPWVRASVPFRFDTDVSDAPRAAMAHPAAAPQPTPPAYEWPLQHPPAIRDMITSCAARSRPGMAAREIDQLVADDSVTSLIEDLELHQLAFDITYGVYNNAREFDKGVFVAGKNFAYLDRVARANSEDSTITCRARFYSLEALRRQGLRGEAGGLISEWGLEEFETYIKYAKPGDDPVQMYADFTGMLLGRWHPSTGSEKSDCALALKDCERLAEELASWETKHAVLRTLPEGEPPKAGETAPLYEWQPIDKMKVRKLVQWRAMENQLKAAHDHAGLGDREEAIRGFVNASKLLDALPDGVYDVGTRDARQKDIKESLSALGVTTGEK